MILLKITSNKQIFRWLSQWMNQMKKYRSLLEKNKFGDHSNKKNN